MPYMPTGTRVSMQEPHRERRSERYREDEPQATHHGTHHLGGNNLHVEDGRWVHCGRVEEQQEWECGTRVGEYQRVDQCADMLTTDAQRATVCFKPTHAGARTKKLADHRRLGDRNIVEYSQSADNDGAQEKSCEVERPLRIEVEVDGLDRAEKGRDRLAICTVREEDSDRKNGRRDEKAREQR